MNDKPGWKTSEFWVMLGTILAGSLAGTGVVEPETVASGQEKVSHFMTGWAPALSGIYIIGRSIFKAFRK